MTQIPHLNQEKSTFVQASNIRNNTEEKHLKFMKCKRSLFFQISHHKEMQSNYLERSRNYTMNI